MINSLKLLTFDATGTILKFRRPPVEIYMDFAKRHGVETEEQKMKEAFQEQWKIHNKSQPHFGTCWKSWWTNFVVGTYKGARVKGVEDSKLNSIASELITHFGTSDCWEVKPGALELLTELSEYQKKTENPICVAVISNFDPRLRQLLRSLNLLQHFDFLILSHESRTSKPSKSMFDWTLEMGSNITHPGRRPLLPEECLHVGDNFKLDYKGATGAGWKGAVVLSNNELDSRKVVGVAGGSEGQKIPPDVTFNSIKDFRDYLFGVPKTS